uniref:Geranylgeranyl transferase type-2 subunit alpha n=1 Tax=Corethron hystrix TaxID=216773 RepID=A0A7S1FRN1_9STRA
MHNTSKQEWIAKISDPKSLAKALKYRQLVRTVIGIDLPKFEPPRELSDQPPSEPFSVTGSKNLTTIKNISNGNNTPKKSDQNILPVPVRKVLDLTAAALPLNPDQSTLWNRRRVALLSSFSSFSLCTELDLTASCLKRNPKSYPAWHHRKWSISKYKSNSLSDDDVVNDELCLTATFLKMDERNFHCWNYRRFIVGIMLGSNCVDGSWPTHVATVMGPQIHQLGTFGVSSLAPSSPSILKDIVRSELNFTSAAVASNFSNSSALHYRSKLLPVVALIDGRDNITSKRLDLARNELQSIVRDAVFTEPHDQTAWWYHRFLIGEFARPTLTDENDVVESYLTLLREEEEAIRELIKVEERGCKWAWVGLHAVISLTAEFEKEVDTDKKLRICLDTLAEIDPIRKARYMSMRKNYHDHVQ